MTLKTDVPFFGNTPDDKHCAQATLRSIRKYFEPHLDLTWNEIDAVMSNPKGTGTWRMAGMMWMLRAGYDVHNIEMLDYEAFAARGLEYVSEYFGPEVAEWESLFFDMPVEQERAKTFITAIDTQRRIPSIQDICTYLDKGYLVQLTVNAQKLNEKTGYVGHAILITGHDDTNFVVHDPGLPAQANRVIAFDLFESAWGNGLESARTLTAYGRD